MVILLYGPDTYRSLEKLHQLVEYFQKRYPSGFGFGRFDFSEPDSFRNFLSFAKNEPIFEEKKLAVLENIAGFSELEKLEKFFQEKKLFDSDNFFIIIREKELPQNSFFESLIEKAQKSQRFSYLLDAKLAFWIKNEVEKRGGRIEPGAVKLLQNYFGSDTWRLSQEIEKLIVFKKAKLIKASDVEKVCDRIVSEQEIFGLVDKVLAGQKKEAFKIFEDLVAEGEDPAAIFNRILGQFRNLLKIKDANSTSQKKKLRFHSYYLKKMERAARFFSWVDLKRAYQAFAEIDIGVKSGRTDYKTALRSFLFEL